MNKIGYLVLVLFLNCSTIFSQNLSGITNKKDTSFSNTRAVLWAIGKHSNAKLALINPNIEVEQNLNISYADRSGRTLQLDVFSPKIKSESKLPALIFIHGGGWRSGDRSQHHPLAKELAFRGYVVITPEYRLSTEALYPAAMQDTKTTIRWVKAHAAEFQIDTNRIAIGGYSAGGQMAALAGTSPDSPLFQTNDGLGAISDRVHAIVDVDGILAYIHPESGEGDDSRSTSAATYYFGYSKTQNPDLWQEASALNHAGAGDPPILFINSYDTRMHAGRNDFIEKYKENGIGSELVEFRDAPHTFPLLQQWFIPTVNTIDNFLFKLFKIEK